ncbi:leucine-rich repeat domain-containing protein [Amycolatopsis sp. NPDC047767]|uniref:leucine-rich repeat domain-containing protein n=1 Tax=Amycolatopsis sp. NPDC047767 TaxID=3156765 RepID=UPI003453CD1F
MRNLEHLHVSGTPVSSLQWATGLSALRSLDLRNAGPLPRLDPLTPLRWLRDLDVRGSGDIDLGELARHRPDVVVHVYRDQHVTGPCRIPAPPRIVRHERPAAN